MSNTREFNQLSDSLNSVTFFFFMETGVYQREVVLPKKYKVLPLKGDPR